MPVWMHRSGSPGATGHKAPNFVLTGGEELYKVLKQFPKDLQKDVLDKAVSAGATLIKKAAQKNLKQNGSIHTGNLYRSLKTEKIKGTHGVYRIFTQGPYAPKDQRGPHAHLVEFGTAPRRLEKPHYAQLKGNWVWVEYTGSMPAKPFFRPAIDENHDKALRKMAIYAAKNMEKYAEKMAGPYSKMSKSFKRKLAA